LVEDVMIIDVVGFERKSQEEGGFVVDVDSLELPCLIVGVDIGLQG
jgi:hypothetical protein